MRLSSAMIVGLCFGWLVVLSIGSVSHRLSAQDSKAVSDKKPETPNMLKPTNKAESWRFEQAEGGKGKMSVEGDWIAFKVTEITGTDWHVQAVQTDLDLKEGKEYKLTFEIKADIRRMATVNAMIDQDDWHEIGLHEELYLGTEGKKQEFTFRATGVAGNKKNRIGFALGLDKGTVFVKNLKLEEVPAPGK